MSLMDHIGVLKYVQKERIYAKQFDSSRLMEG